MECLEGGELLERVNRGRFAEKDAADAAYQMLVFFDLPKQIPVVVVVVVPVPVSLLVVVVLLLLLLVVGVVVGCGGEENYGVPAVKLMFLLRMLLAIRYLHSLGLGESAEESSI